MTPIAPQGHLPGGGRRGTRMMSSASTVKDLAISPKTAGANAQDHLEAVEIDAEEVGLETEVVIGTEETGEDHQRDREVDLQDQEIETNLEEEEIMTAEETTKIEVTTKSLIEEEMTQGIEAEMRGVVEGTRGHGTPKIEVLVGTDLDPTTDGPTLQEARGKTPEIAQLKDPITRET